MVQTIEEITGAQTGNIKLIYEIYLSLYGELIPYKEFIELVKAYGYDLPEFTELIASGTYRSTPINRPIIEKYDLSVIGINNSE